jgi:hypothetical protein
MATTLADLESIRGEQMRHLSEVKGPCVSIYLAVHMAEDASRRAAIHLKNQIHEAEQALGKRNLNEQVRTGLLRPLYRLLEDADTWGRQGPGFAIFSAPGFFRVVRLDQQPPECVEVGNHIFILPALRILQEDRDFLLLSLSRKNIKLYHCTRNSIEEMRLPEGVPASLNDYLTTPGAEESARQSAGGGPEGGYNSGEFTSSADRDNDEYVINFYKAVNKGLFDFLKQDGRPLVTAGVEKESGIYQRVNTYSQLTKAGVRGAPDGIRTQDLHQRALEAVQEHHEQPIDRARQQFEDLGGSDRATTTIKSIVKAAYEGRVSHLLLAEGASYRGRWDDTRAEVRPAGEPGSHDDELLNAAAVQTVLSSGVVHVLPTARIPNGASAAAILRY